MTSVALPRRVRYKDRETALSLSLRLAHRHGDSWQCFSSGTGLPVSPLRLSLALDRLAALSRVERVSIEPFTPVWYGHEVEVLGHRMDRSRFLRLNLRLCPMCMVQDVEERARGERPEDAAYLRLEWCLAFVYGCQRHGAKLITRCPACGERPRWDVGRIDRCHCGRRLLLDKPVLLSPSEAELLTMLLARLRSEPLRDGALAPLATIPLPDAVNLLRLIGEVASGKGGAGITSPSLEVDDLPTLLLRGVEAMSSLPGSFEEMLDGILEVRPKTGPGIVGSYGLPLVRWMRSERPFIEVLRPIFDDHATRSGIVPAPAANGEPRTSASLFVERREELISADEARRLRVAVDWKGPLPPTRQEIVVAAREIGFAISLVKAADYLGVRREVFACMRDRRYVLPVWAAPAGAHQLFYKAELDTLLERLKGGARLRATPIEGSVTITELVKGGGLSLLDVLSSLFEGRSRCTGVVPGIGVRQLLVRRADFRPLAPKTDFMSQVAVCAALDMHPREVETARALGLLDEFKRSNCKASSVESIRLLAASYVSWSRVMRATVRTRATTRHRLYVKGAQRVGGARIFRREEIERLFPEIRLDFPLP